MKVLLVEDDVPIGYALNALLVIHRYKPTWVKTAEDAKRFLTNERFDLLLFDIPLPDASGLELLTWCRASGVADPVLIITARDTVADCVQGLDLGADDYLAKPFEMPELLARMRALLRRHAAQKTAVWQVGMLTIDTARHTVSLHGNPVALSRREYAVLSVLARTPGNKRKSAATKTATRWMCMCTACAKKLAQR
jgi:two-component system, OmpR family, response regulator QseB